MQKNPFEIGAQWSDGWSSDNKEKNTPSKEQIKPPSKHQLHFAKEKRNGKIITIVKPFYMNKADLEQTLKTLKKSLATGGTAKENTLEFQGEIQERLREKLTQLGFCFK